MASIETRKQSDGTTRYRVRITLKGHPRQSETFPTRRKAERWAQKTEAAMREGRYAPGSEAERRTFGELAQRYIEEEIPKRAKPERHAKQLGWWADQLGEETPLVRITPPRIVEVREKLKRGAGPSGRPVSSATVNRYLALLSRAFAVAMKEWFWTDDNPLRKVSKRKEPRGRARFLSEDERTRLLYACRKSDVERLYPLVLTALATGARQGELLRLTWNDLDLDRAAAVFHHTKNGERRSVAVTGAALAELKRRGRTMRWTTTRVFQGPRGKASFPKKAWHKALEAAEVEDFFATPSPPTSP